LRRRVEPGGVLLADRRRRRGGCRRTCRPIVERQTLEHATGKRANIRVVEDETGAGDADTTFQATDEVCHHQ
jgi:hypothetical protein